MKCVIAKHLNKGARLEVVLSGRQVRVLATCKILMKD